MCNNDNQHIEYVTQLQGLLRQNYHTSVGKEIKVDKITHSFV